jgi:DNA-binding CsgD family transcriptional regulator
MTARLISVPPRLQPQIELGQCSRKRSSHRSTSKKSFSHHPLAPVDSDRYAKMQESDRISQDALWEVLLGSIREGVLVVSRTLQPVYLNCQAKEICQQLQETREGILPIAVTEACHRLMREEGESVEPLVVEYQERAGQCVRLQVRWISFNSATSEKSAISEKGDQAYILILLEDCYASLREELALEQKKYDLTDREAEIWMLLRQEYTYQDISDILQISLNTVKTHVKNVYAKRKSLFGQRKVWFSR